MKALRIVLFVLFGLLAIYSIMCAVGPKDIDTGASATMAAPASVIYANISSLKNWENWSTWHEMDPDMKITYSGPESGIGNAYAWDGEKAGTGKMEIVEAIPNESMKTRIEFGDFEGFNNGIWRLENAGDGNTTVHWDMKSGQPFPFLMRGMMLLMGMEKNIVKDFNKGLANLKVLSEEQAANPPQNSSNMEIQRVEFSEQRYAVVKERIKMSDLQAFYTKGYGAVQAQIAKNDGMEATGMPCGLYYDWDPEGQETTVAAAIPINLSGTFEAPVEEIVLPTSPAVLIDYYGNYDGLGAPHEAIDAYLKANNLEANLPCIEVYQTDPGQEPDPAKWLTKIYYTLK